METVLLHRFGCNNAFTFVQIMAGARLHPRRDAGMADSVRAFEVLPEIMQQAARVNDPHAAARREFIRLAARPILLLPFIQLRSP